jgi:HEAT repeats
MTRLIVLLAAFALPARLEAQTLAQRVATAGDGTIRLSFAARRGVCGNGGNNITIADEDEHGEWESDCAPGPVRMSLRVSGGKVTEAHTYVGGRWRPAQGPTTDLGTVPASQAAADLLKLAERADGDADALITGATLADSAVVWPELLRVARKTELPLETRRQAVFWLGQAAGQAAARGLDSITTDEQGDIEVRKQAVFALSQRPADEGVPALIRVARTSPSGELRKSALFWLGQSEDPRALSLFEELLR